MHDLDEYISYDEICFIDCETRSAPNQADPRWENVTLTSTDRYADNAWPIIITWAFGLEGEVCRWEITDITKPPSLDDIPMSLRRWDGYFAAWNSGFDRKILRRYFAPEHTNWLDMMVHASYNNMPMGLDRASKACHYGGKMAAGKTLIKLFCSSDGALPEDRPKEWNDFCEYADVDVEQMQNVAQSTMPVPLSIWRESWVSEAINDRGLPFDRDMAKGGKALADAYAERLSSVMSGISAGEITGPKQYVRQREWVWNRVIGNPFVAKHMIDAHRVNAQGEDEYVLKMDRPTITKMIAALETLDEKDGLTDDEFAVLQLLEEREYGASSAPAKFDKMLAMATADDRLTGQYVFGGATQTGRYSSRGVQMHNMTRSTIGDLTLEMKACEDMADGISLDDFATKYGNAGKALSRLIRPTIVAPEKKTLVWGDWSNIEARALPWLAMDEDRLDIFRNIDADPKNSPDVYLRAAAGMYGHDPMKLLEGHRNKDPEVKDLRQKGKISELALGFAGGPGALQSMAANYGMIFAEDEAQDIVKRWRGSNEWATVFWNEVWEAFIAAARNPGETQYAAGRVKYQGLHIGDEIWVVCYLPDNRPLFYRNVKERVDVTYDPFDASIVLEKTMKLSFQGEAGIKFLWRGILVENITQAICASILRNSLVHLEGTTVDTVTTVIGHTHDEILLETSNRSEAEDLLYDAMMRAPDWHDGLPLGVDIECNSWYSKALE